MKLHYVLLTWGLLQTIPERKQGFFAQKFIAAQETFSTVAGSKLLAVLII